MLIVSIIGWNFKFARAFGQLEPMPQRTAYNARYAHFGMEFHVCVCVCERSLWFCFCPDVLECARTRSPRIRNRWHLGSRNRLDLMVYFVLNKKKDAIEKQQNCQRVSGTPKKKTKN